MKYYLVNATYGTQCKNALQKQIYNDLIAAHRQLIPEDKIESFKAIVLESINTFNKANPRCTPIKASWWQPYKNYEAKPQDWNLSGCEFISLQLMQSTNLIKNL